MTDHNVPTDPQAINQPCATICPFLGLPTDQTTALAFPAHVNGCFRAEQGVAVDMSYQAEVCLTPEHVGCLRYADPEFLVPTSEPAPTAVPTTRLVLGLTVVILLVVGLVLAWPTLSAMVLNGDVLAQGERPLLTPIQAHTATPFPTPTLRPTLVPTAESIALLPAANPASATPTAEPTATDIAPTATAVVPTSTPPPTNTPVVVTAIVSTGALNVRSAPFATAEATAVLFNGADIQLVARSENGRWGQLILEDSTPGWVSLAFVTLSGPVMDLPVVGGSGQSSVIGEQ